MCLEGIAASACCVLYEVSLLRCLTVERSLNRKRIVALLVCAEACGFEEERREALLGVEEQQDRGRSKGDLEFAGWTVVRLPMQYCRVADGAAS